MQISEYMDTQRDILSNLRVNFELAPRPKQAEVLSIIGSGQHRRYAIKSVHEWGKTWVAAAAGIDWLSRQPKPMLLSTAPTVRQVKHMLWKELKAMARKKAKDFGWTVLPEDCRIMRGPEMIAYGFSTDDPSKFEGYHQQIVSLGQRKGQLMVIVDEAKGVPDEIFESIDSTDPALLFLISTPGNPAGRFYEAFLKPHYHHITIDGHLYNESTGENTPMSFIEDMRLNYGEDSPVYQRRVRAEFSIVAEHPYYNSESIDRAIANNASYPMQPRGLSIDWGRHVDFTALADWRDRRVIDVRTTKEDYMVTIGKIVKEHQAWPYNWIVADMGAGEGQFLRMKELGLPVEGIKSSSGLSMSYDEMERVYRVGKLTLHSALKLMLDGGEMALPQSAAAQEEMVMQLKVYEEVPRSDGSIKLGAPHNLHDDIVDALAMGAFKLRQPRREVRMAGFPGDRGTVPGRRGRRRMHGG